jgi:hypothetical protein
VASAAFKQLVSALLLLLLLARLPCTRECKQTGVQLQQRQKAALDKNALRNACSS